jgi:hypothetical protein
MTEGDREEPSFVSPRRFTARGHTQYQTFFGSFFQKRTRFFLKKEAKTFIRA